MNFRPTANAYTYIYNKSSYKLYQMCRTPLIYRVNWLRYAKLVSLIFSLISRSKINAYFPTGLALELFGSQSHNTKHFDFAFRINTILISHKCFFSVLTWFSMSKLRSPAPRPYFLLPHTQRTPSEGYQHTQKSASKLLELILLHTHRLQHFIQLLLLLQLQLQLLLRTLLPQGPSAIIRHRRPSQSERLKYLKNSLI